MIYTLNADEINRQNGFVGAVGIGIGYKSHSSDSSAISGVVTSLNGSFGWNWKDYAKMEFSGVLGAGTNNINGNYPMGVTNSLSNLNFKGGMFLNFGFDGKGGYNVLSPLKSWDNALFINGGANIDILLNSATYTPFATQFSLLNFFLELEGRSAINKKWRIDYFVRGLFGANITSIGGNDIQVSSPATQSSVFGGKIGLGFSYKIGDEAFFFMRLVGTYHHISKGEIIHIAIQNNPQTNGLIANAKTDWRLPKNHLFYGGLHFGIGI